MVVTVYTALIIAIGMAVYAVYQYFASPGMTVLGLILQHSWHVVAYGVLLYLSLSLVLYRNVVRPVQQLNVKLYAISKGDLSPVSVDSNVEEIQEIAQVVNFLLAQIEKAVPDVSVSELSESSQELRTIAHESDALEDSAKEALVGIANQVDEVVEALAIESLHRQEGAGGEGP